MSNEKGSLWMAARIARTLTGTARPKVNPVLAPLIVVHRKFHPKANLEVLNRAYNTAERLHDGVMRKSGEPYITHPLAVATIAAEIGMDTTTLVAALLHDTVEDTDYSLEELTADFGEEVARLVDGVTKLDKVALGSAAEAETVRKMIVAMSHDPRVLVIKVCDRLHNMRTMRFLPPEKQAKKARETLEVIAPLAHRLGMATVKWELEDLAFAILYPRKYEEIVRIVADRAPQRDQYIACVKDEIESAMQDTGINAEVVGRPKHYWSIYQKMIVRGRDFDEIFDLVGIRILVGTVRDCYAAVGAVHALYQPMPGRFKDYISSPRFGVYKSLHTTVLGPDAKPLEIQIRTLEMHRNAEYGIAAHWRYKETRGTHSGNSEDLDQMAWMRQLLDWQKEAADPNEFLDSLRYDLSTDEIFVFTPKGDAITLPAGATPVDFAYSVHTEVGHRCIGAKVNGRLVALESKLQTGDKVEIFTSKDQSAGPSKDWLSFVVVPRARARIKQWFAKERRGEAVEVGRDALAAEVQRNGVPVQRLFTPESVRALAADLGYDDVDALYAAIGRHDVTAGHVVNQLMDQLAGEDDTPPMLPNEVPVHPASRIANTPQEGRGDGSGILVQGEADFSAKLAKCCTPVPGDAIFGFITKGGGVSVHRTDCTNAPKLHQDQERIIEVGWAQSFQNAVFLVTIQIEGLDRNGLLSEVTRVVSEQKVPIIATSSRTSEDRVAMIRFTFEVSDTKQLGYLMGQLRNIEGVFDVYRVTTGG